jgi:transcriptional regulator of acetoin/glycerol metabolism
MSPSNSSEVTEDDSAMLNKPNDITNETLRVYNKNNANISQTAKMLGVSRNTLYKRLRELNIK